MRNYLIFKEKARQFGEDREIQSLLAEIRSTDPSFEPVPLKFTKERAEQIKSMNLNRAELTKKRLPIRKTRPARGRPAARRQVKNGFRHINEGCGAARIHDQAPRRQNRPSPKRDFRLVHRCDVADSAFTTIIVTTFYAQYFSAIVVGDEGRADLLWGVSAPSRK